MLPGKSHGQRSLVGYSPWDHKRVEHNIVTKQQPTIIVYTYIYIHIYMYIHTYIHTFGLQSMGLQESQKRLSD